MFGVEFLEHSRDTTSSYWLVTAGAEGSTFAMIMRLAIWLPFMLKERTSVERFPAFPADEAIRMPLCVQCGDVVLHNGFVASAAFWCEHIEVVGPAIGLAIALVEAILAELLATLGTEEVLSVPGLLQSCYAFIQDRSIAVSASRRKEVVIIRLAVWPAVLLEEVPRAQLLGAMSASEVLRMPSAAQRCDHLSDDGFLASVAASLLGSLYSLSAHVCAQGSEHVIERGGLWSAVVVFLPGTLLAVHVCAACCRTAAAHLKIGQRSHKIIEFFSRT